MSQFLLHCGQLLNSIRQRRNLSINDIRGDATQPTVTNFEHGHSDIGLTNFHTLLTNMYMSTDEFFVLADPGSDLLSRFARTLRHASNHDDLAGLAALREEVITAYPGSRKDGPKDMLLLSIQGMAGFIKDHAFMFSEIDASRLQLFLNHGQTWYYLEYTIFAVTAPFLPTPIMVQLADAMLASFHTTHIPDYDVAVMGTLFNMCFALLARGDKTQAVKFLQRTQQGVPQTRDSFTASRIYLLTQAFTYLGNHSPEALHHIKMIEDSWALFDPQMRESDMQWLSQLGIKL
ncbi:Rgg family transcriptional regulator [Schleiferilactobacillus harbinensis]|uniref:Rgg family transcriptional regulator n=1 Tax=Schleiferilactobacillus harbinensis TaxID=304207 RepID=UPI001174342E|nr:hypothetical protein [Schleiferilactobacillus harbinensis]GEK07696.1 hypothetical protein LHA01_29350 [Schleiferilactobacillus harbinensis]